jgi:PKD repeat protein
MAIDDDLNMRKAAISQKKKSDILHDTFILASIVIAPLIAIGLSTISNEGSTEPNLHGPWVDTVWIGSSDVDNTLWNRTYDAYATGNDALQGTWVDSSGNVYTTGYTGLSGTYDVVLVKWSSAGNVIWNRTFGNNLYELGYGIWGNDAGLVFTCGSTSSVSNGSDFQLVSWNAATGDPVRNLTFSTVDHQVANTIWGDDKGWVYLAGYTHVGGTNYDYLLVKWSTANTTMAWSKQWDSGHNNDQCNSITGDAAGYIYTNGYSNNGTGEAPNAIVMRRYASNGSIAWARAWGAPAFSYGYGIWYDGSGSLYSTGEISDSIDGYDNLFLLKLQASNGTEAWNRTYSPSRAARGVGVWADGAGYIYTGGYDDQVALLVKWNATGTQFWNRTLAGSGAIRADAIWGYGTGTIYSVGISYGSSFNGFVTKWNCADSIPTIAFAADPNPCIPNYEVYFTYTGTTLDMIAFYEWEFGDSSPKSNVANPVHNYTSVGIYTIILKILDVDGDGGTNTFSNAITIVNDLPVSATFTVNDTYPVTGQDVQFTHTGLQGNQPTSYYWEFGDGGESYQRNPIHAYTTVGNYNVTLYVDDIDDSASLTVNYCVFVFQDYPVVANYSMNASSVEDGEAIQFLFTGSAPNGIQTYLWNFGDGTTSTSDIPTHKYAKPGTYTISLTIIDPDGDSDTIQKVIVVGGVDEELVTTVVIVSIAIGAGAVVGGFVVIRKLRKART